MTRIAPSGDPRSSTTDQTGARSASPEGVGGVSTQEKKICASAFSSSTSSVNVSRSRLRSISSARPGSWNGTRPAFSSSIFAGIDVPDDDVVTEIGEAGARDEADPPGPEDAEGRLRFAHARDSTCGRA